MTVKIPLTRGMVALVDDADAEDVSRYKWQAHKSTQGELEYFCAVRGDYDAATKKTHTVYMHRLILNAPEGSQIDHINGDELDNRRANLRFCSPSENQNNARKRRSATSQYKGVCRRGGGHTWRARIRPGRRTIYLGDFTTEEEAARAYDKAARLLYGEFALLNFAGEVGP